MDPSHQTFAPSSPFPSRSRQNKAISQRQYRANEGECFTTLRELIKELTEEDLQTRQEILRKAIDLLLAASEIRKSREAHVAPPISYEVPYLAENVVPVHIGHVSDSSSWPPSWHSAIQSDPQSASYVSQSHGRQDRLIFNMGSDFNHENSSGYGDGATTDFLL